MGEALIVRRGGGGGNALAVIGVTYPTGSVCICTNGARTLKARDTSGAYLFYIPTVGTWTVSCTNGIDTTSAAVTINAQYQAKNVELSYTLTLYNAGVTNTAVVGSWACVGNNTKKITEQADNLYFYIGRTDIGHNAVYYATKPITIKHKTLHFSFTARTTDGGTTPKSVIVGLKNQITDTTASSVLRTFVASNSGSDSLDVDISGCIGQTLYVAVYMDSTAAMHITNISMR